MSDKAIVPWELTAMQGMAEKIKSLKAFMDGNLEKGIDWEHTHTLFKRQLKPGDEARSMLLDPGCAKIMNFMGVRPRHRVLEKEIDQKTGNLRYVVAVEIVTYLPVMYHDPATEISTPIYPVVAEGVGSSTTREKRYKVKWEWFKERDLKVEGFTDPDLAKYRENYPDRYREGTNNLYYMSSAESLGLDNTLIKMAAKRAAMDAVFQLPGVAGRYSQEVDLHEAKTGKREPKPQEKSGESAEPAEALAEDAESPTDPVAVLRELLIDIWMEYPEHSSEWLLDQAKQIMESSDGLIVSMDSALKVLRKRLKREEATPSPKEEAKKASSETVIIKDDTKEAVGETITSKDGTVLGKLVVEGRNAAFTPSMEFTVDTPPFRSFLLGRVFAGMAARDAERAKDGELTEGEVFDFEVTEDNYRITCIDMINYGGERRLNEIASSTRWTFEKMLDKQREGNSSTAPPEPSFNRADGEVVMCADEVKARAAVQGLTGSDQLGYKIGEGGLWVSPTKFLGDAWNPINDALKPLGAMWITVKPSHWEIKGKKKKTQKPLEAPSSLSIESVEKKLTEIHGDLAMQRLAVTENASFITVEPYQSLTSEEQTAFDKTLKGMGATVNDKGREILWYLRKPKGDK